MTSETTTPELVEQILAEASIAAPLWAATPAADRAVGLVAVADALDAAADELVPLAHDETHIPDGRLRFELGRTTFQLRLFADVLTEGSYLDARIDPADDAWPMGAPRPDLRRVLEPIGPVVVFAASNFPFAFSVAGGDTASALAAGCPVVLKVHPGHPRLSVATARVVRDALASTGAPTGLFALVTGTRAAQDVLTDGRIKAGSFTGSIAGGRALLDIAGSRPEPIPFYAEMGSVNPTFVTRAAAAARPQEIAAGYLESMSMSAGQLCTKPGVLVVPEDSDIPQLLRSSERPAAGQLLNERIQEGYVEVLERLMSHESVVSLTDEEGAYAAPPAPTILLTDVDAVIKDPAALLVECFGPTSLVVTYRDEASLVALAAGLEGQLTATILGEEGDDVHALVRLLATRAGRLLWNQWPTGVSVTYAQQHGGPYPATSVPGSTSVGTAAIDRFLRPVAYQNFPQALLPPALRDDNPERIPRRADGVTSAG
ncbi:MAG: aldehyde dehydrogenase [Aeromicrobium sp.]|nr:aldehyde dehydrogenase [Aeromicrobium sp.]